MDIIEAVSNSMKEVLSESQKPEGMSDLEWRYFNSRLIAKVLNKVEDKLNLGPVQVQKQN